MKISLFDIVFAISSFLVTPILGVPIVNNTGSIQQQQQQQADIGTCSAQVESTLAMERWDDIKPDQLLQKQKEYLAVNRGKLLRCGDFEKGNVEECVVLATQSSDTPPEVYIHHLCELLN
ncbi:hypothetical protein TWF281_002346 [Arthrobotrys megalospora]